MNRSWSEPVQTGLVTAKNRKRLVHTGPVRFFAGFGIVRTGLGLGLRRLRQKTETGPDFQTLFLDLIVAGTSSNDLFRFKKAGMRVMYNSWNPLE